jgi:phospholipid transport system substrate-binding protein
MKRRHFLPLLALAPLPTFAVGSLDAAQTRLRSAIDEVLAIALKAKDRASLMAQIGVVLERHISFAVMTRRAVGPGWRQFSPAQQSQAIASFSRLIIRSYGNKFTIGEKPQIDYKSAAATGEGRVDVSTTTPPQPSSRCLQPCATACRDGRPAPDWVRAELESPSSEFTGTVPG